MEEKMGLLKLLGTLFVVGGGLAMTLHILKEMKTLEIWLWWIVIGLLVAFLVEIFNRIVIKLDLLFELLSKIAARVLQD